MALPGKELRDQIKDLLATDPTPNSEYTRDDLQGLACGLRLATDGSSGELLALAHALDALSELTPADIRWLRSLKPADPGLDDQRMWEEDLVQPRHLTEDDVPGPVKA